MMVSNCDKVNELRLLGREGSKVTYRLQLLPGAFYVLLSTAAILEMLK